VSRPYGFTPRVPVAVEQHVIRLVVSNRRTIRQAAEEAHLSTSTVHRILRSYGYRPRRVTEWVRDEEAS
jgi:hypothetical protein